VRRVLLLLLLLPLLVPATAAAIPGYRIETEFTSPADYEPADTLHQPFNGTAGLGLPFPVRVYGVEQTGASTSSRGYLLWGGTIVGLTRSCLPADFGEDVFAPYWSDDLRIDRMAHPDDGIYTETRGSAPNRQFVIEWRTHRMTGGEARVFELILNEGSPIVSFLYFGFTGGSDATSGVQQAGTMGNFTQNHCGSVSLVSGQRVDFIPDPLMTAPPTVSGEAVEGRALTASAGVWDGTDPVDTFIVWLRCDPDGTNCNAIPGATGPTYTLGPTDVNRTLRVRASASSAGGDDFADSEPSALVTAAAVETGGGVAGSSTQSSGEEGDAAALLTGLAVRPRAFRRGTRISYVLDRPASVRFRVQRRVSRRRWRRVKGSFTDAGAAGANSLRFGGRMRGRRLRPGRYRLLATPAGGVTTRAPFRIVPR
jgi:hypothetical protein